MKEGIMKGTKEESKIERKKVMKRRKGKREEGKMKERKEGLTKERSLFRVCVQKLGLMAT